MSYNEPATMANDSRKPREHVERVLGVPRSAHEMDFYATLRPCPICGDHSLLQWSTVGGSGTVWRTRADCPTCETRRVYVFSADPDLLDVETDSLEVGGSEPSTLFGPEDLKTEIARILELLPHERGDSISDVNRAWDLFDNLRIAVNELAKFVATDPVRFGTYQASLESERSRVLHLFDILPPMRVASDVSVATAAAEKHGTIDRATAAAHRAWLNRGGVGSGRMVVVGLRARDLRMDGGLMKAARLEHVDLRGASIGFSDWSESELTHCDFSSAKMSSTGFEHATIVDCSFSGSSADHVKFDGARISGCSLEGASLNVSSWRASVVSHSSLADSKFANSKWEGARFEHCDLRRITLAPKNRLPLTSFKGAVFVDCDLRDADFSRIDLTRARFEGCAFGGAHGTPIATAGLVLVDADFSPARDRSVIGDVGELLAQLEGPRRS